MSSKKRNNIKGNKFNSVAGLRRIDLPKPSIRGGMPFSAALNKRRTIREISGKKLSMQAISNLLWAAAGINREKGPFKIPGITAASASNSQEIILYTAMQDGIYFYHPASHSLEPVVEGDFRQLATGVGQGKAGAKAALRIIYVVDIDKFAEAGFQEPGLQNPETQKAYYYVDTGMIAANVYLAAASQGLAAWFHNCDRQGIHSKLRLGKNRLALFGQSVGYPGKKTKR